MQQISSQRKKYHKQEHHLGIPQGDRPKDISGVFELLVEVIALSNDINSLQHSPSLLTISAIQQFLDELTFRELCAHHPLLAFDSLVDRISTQTAASQRHGTTFFNRMKSVVSDPTNDWRITQHFRGKDDETRAVVEQFEECEEIEISTS